MFKRNKDSLISILVLIAIILLNFLITTRKIQANDYFWHLKTGEYVLQHMSVPTSDVFSWYGVSNHLDWFAHEWLSGVIYYVIYTLFGHGGNVVFVPVVISIVLGFLYMKNKENFFKNFLFSSIWFIIMIVQFARSSSPRPHIIGYLLILSITYIVDKYRREDTKLIWVLPFIAVIWANAHGGSSSMVYMIPSLLLITSIFNFKLFRIKGTKLPLYKIKALVTSIILSILAIGINPKGLKMILYPYVNMGDKLLLSTISEWASPDIKTNVGLLIFIIIGAVYLLLLTVKDDIDFYELGLLGMFTYLSLESLRFTALFMIAITPIFLKYLPEINIKRYVEYFKFPLISSIVIMGIIAPVFLYENITTPLKVSSMPSDKAISVIKEVKPEKLLNLYDWGGYLIYKDIPVFIDGRADIYSKNIYPEYIDMVTISDKTKKYLEKYDFDMIIFNTDSAMKVYLDELKSYKEVYSDDVTTIFEKVK